MQLVVLLVTLIACIVSAERTSPLILWSNREGLVGKKGQGAQVDYSVTAGDSRGAILDSIMALMGKKSDASPLLAPSSSDIATKHLTMVVFIGSHLDAAAMRKGAASLSSVLDSSAASLAMPYASCTHQKGASKTLSSSLDSAGINYKSVGCASDSASDDLASDVSSALSSSSPDASQVLLVCSPAATSTLAQELEQLLSVQEAVDASERSHVVLYLSEKSNEEGPGRHRVLATTPAPATSGSPPLIGFGPYTTCGQLCQTQVRWLEGILTVLFMAVALSAGLTCLNVLNGPSKFDVQKAD